MTDIDEFLAGLPGEKRSALESLRGTIAKAAPAAVDAISYGVPAFTYRGRPLVSFGAGKQHCAFYVQSPAVMWPGTKPRRARSASPRRAAAGGPRHEARQGADRRDR
ncbi:MAG: iron chaperone, partial [Gaiellaceae bacterium]